MPTRITQSRYDATLRKIEEAHRKRALEQAEDLAEMAKTLAPVKTGALRDSIHVEVERRVPHVVVGVSYGASVEYGSANGMRAARPYMSPAVEYVKRKYRNKKLKIDLFGVK
jgi:hypothetical protein